VPDESIPGGTGQPGAASPEPAPEAVPGYSHLVPIGRGGFSVVYRAHQDAFDRDVALKILRGDSDAEAARRFEREVRLTGRLTGHPHVVTALDAGTTPAGHPYLAMDLYEGGSLAGRAAAGPLPAAEVAAIGAKIAAALADAHALGILHRDVKPDNILMSRFGEPALADFGVAFRADATASSTVGAFTPHHAAPEVLRGETAEAAADVYALGSTLYQLVTGRPPFLGADPGSGGPGDIAALLYRIVNYPPPPLEVPELPGLADAIMTALAKEPGQRQPSAAAFAEQLRGLAADGQPTHPTEALPLIAAAVADVASAGASGEAPTIALSAVGVPTAIPSVPPLDLPFAPTAPAYPAPTAEQLDEPTLALRFGEDEFHAAAAERIRRSDRRGKAVMVAGLAVVVAVVGTALYAMAQNDEGAGGPRAKVGAAGPGSPAPSDASGASGSGALPTADSSDSATSPRGGGDLSASGLDASAGGSAAAPGAPSSAPGSSGVAVSAPGGVPGSTSPGATGPVPSSGGGVPSSAPSSAPGSTSKPPTSPSAPPSTTVSKSCTGWHTSHVVAQDGWGTSVGSWNLKVGPYEACGNNPGSLPSGAKFWFWCYTVNAYGNTWVYGRVDGTSNYGWESIANFSGVKSPQLHC
jgi:serine/threonine-protein kinase PknK